MLGDDEARDDLEEFAPSQEGAGIELGLAHLALGRGIGLAYEAFLATVHDDLVEHGGGFAVRHRLGPAQGNGRGQGAKGEEDSHGIGAAP